MMLQKWARPPCSAGERCHIGSSTIVTVRAAVLLLVSLPECQLAVMTRRSPYPALTALHRICSALPCRALELVTGLRHTCCWACTSHHAKQAAVFWLNQHAPMTVLVRMQGLWDRLGAQLDWSLAVHAYGVASNRQWPNSYTFGGECAFSMRGSLQSSLKHVSPESGLISDIKCDAVHVCSQQHMPSCLCRLSFCVACALGIYAALQHIRRWPCFTSSRTRQASLQA